MPCKYRALTNWAASPRYAASIRFLFVRPAICFRLPSDSQSPATPLPSASTSPCRACRGLSPPSRPVHHHSEPNSASHGATRHAWRTQQKRPASLLALTLLVPGTGIEPATFALRVRSEVPKKHTKPSKISAFLSGCVLQNIAV